MAQLLDQFGRPLAPAPARRMMRPIRARYDAAQLTADDRNHWVHADSLSARSANNPAVRERLRNNARYEVANNCYARGIVDTIADVVIGYGPTLSFRRDPRQPLEMEALRELAQLFNDWAEEIDLWGKLRTMRIAKCQDGEAFAIFRTNTRLPFVQLDLQLIEAEQVTDGINQSWDPTRVDGIETDKQGNITGYRILPEHPGDAVSVSIGQPVLVPAGQVLHWYRIDRPGQLRGIPEITPALPLFAQLRRFTLATLTAAETAADFAAVITSDIVPDDEQSNPFDEIDIARGMMLTLPDGRKIQQLQAEHPTTTYEMFKREILQEIGRCLQLPRLAVLLDASGYNYASGRLDKQVMDRSIEVERHACEVRILRKVWDAWFAEAMRMPGYLPAAVEAGLAIHLRWLWRELGHVDREKEAKGAELDLKIGKTTLAEECARNGEDWIESAIQRAAEVAFLNELGLNAAAPQESNSNANEQGQQTKQSTVGDDGRGDAASN